MSAPIRLDFDWTLIPAAPPPPPQRAAENARASPHPSKTNDNSGCTRCMSMHPEATYEVAANLTAKLILRHSRPVARGRAGYGTPMATCNLLGEPHALANGDEQNPAVPACQGRRTRCKHALGGDGEKMHTPVTRVGCNTRPAHICLPHASATKFDRCMFAT